jgi:anti-anti-sigma regulatory factor
MSHFSNDTFPRAHSIASPSDAPPVHVLHLVSARLGADDIGESKALSVTPVSMKLIDGGEPDEMDVLRMVGELDFSIADDVRSLLEQNYALAYIDLSDVRFVDASIINELVRWARRLKPKRATLIGASAHVQRLLALLKLTAFFDLADEAKLQRPRLVFKSGI